MNQIGKTYGISVNYTDKVQQPYLYPPESSNANSQNLLTTYKNEKDQIYNNINSSPNHSNKEQPSNQLHTQNVLLSSQPSQKNHSMTEKAQKDSINTQPPTTQINEHKFAKTQQSSFLKTHYTQEQLMEKIKEINQTNDTFRHLDVTVSENSITKEVKEHKYVIEQTENSEVPTRFIGSVESLKTIANCRDYAANIRKILPIKASIFLKLFTAEPQYIVIEHLCGEAGQGRSILKVDSEIFGDVIRNVYNILKQQFTYYTYFEDLITEYAQTYGLKQWNIYFRQFPWLLSQMYTQDYDKLRPFIEQKNHLIKKKKEFYSTFIKYWAMATGDKMDVQMMQQTIKRSQMAKLAK